MCVVDCTDLSCKDLHRQVGMGVLMTTWCNGSTLAWNARDVDSIPAVGTIFHHTHDTYFATPYFS